MKPKTNRKGDKHEASNYDKCQTPPYAVEPLLPFIPEEWVIWECAAGEGFLARAMRDAGRNVIATDIDDGFDFFDMPAVGDVIVTNPPYSASVKFPWIERCYFLGIPFALLMPLETLGAARAQKQFDKYGMNLMALDKRVDFKMPNAGWDGSGAQFPVAWFTHRIPGIKPVHYAKIVKRDMRQIIMF